MAECLMCLCVFMWSSNMRDSVRAFYNSQCFQLVNLNERLLIEVFFLFILG